MASRAGNEASGVHAVISPSALADNARGLAGTADLRRDACGHGALACAPVLADCGLRLLVDVDAPDAVRALPAATTRVEGDFVDPAALWGLPGGSGRAVMSLHGSVLSTKPLRAREGVSYGYVFRAPADTHIALVCGGYAQGIVREVGSRVRVRLHEASVPIVGRVAMDACVIEIGDQQVARGDEVTFFGDPLRGEPGLGDWVAVTGLTAIEIVSLVGARARRRVGA